MPGVVLEGGDGEEVKGWFRVRVVEGDDVDG